MKLLFFSTLLISALLFSACDEDEHENHGSFTVTVQDTETQVFISKATLTVSGGQTAGSGQGSNTLRIAGGVMEDSITISISNWEFQEPPDNAIITKDYYNEDLCQQVSENKNVCEGAIIQYLEGDKIYWSFSKDETTLILHITKCDGNRVSGTFNLDLENVYDNDDKKTVSGEFTDLLYTVRNTL
jgi:hypothetical protein